MTTEDKRSRKQTKKKQKAKTPGDNLTGLDSTAQEPSSDLIQSVVDSMEMAGKALDFFESDEPFRSFESEPADFIQGAESAKLSLQEVERSAIDGAEPEEELSLLAEELPAELDDDQELAPTNEATEFVDQDTLLAILESVLFATEKPIGLGTFKVVFKGTNISVKEIKQGLVTLQASYADHKRGVTLDEISGGWQLRTKVDNMPFLRKLGKSRPFKLSGPALEVLSIVAYKQPIVKSEVDHIRGVESGHLLRALMERGLISFDGKSDLPGKPMLYGTSRKFLEIFSLRNLKELPSLEEIDQLLPEGIGYEEEEDETLSSVTDAMAEDYAGNYSEGEEELVKIVDKLSGIDTSTDFFEEEKLRQKELRERERAQDIQERLDLDELVEEKDKKWLERYLAAQMALSTSAESSIIAANEDEEMSEGGEAAPAAVDAGFPTERSVD